MTVLLGAVAYDPKVVTIWTGFRDWLRDQRLPFDYVLYSNYERQTEDLVAGRIHAAWHSPLAWVRTCRLAKAAGRPVYPLVMRDTDQDLTSVIVTRSDAPHRTPADLTGGTVALGAVDSPQATLIPSLLLHQAGLTHGENVTIRRFDIGVGLHGDHIGGEREAARALAAGDVDAAAMTDGNHLLFNREGTLPSGGTRVLAATAPYDHCVLAIADSAPTDLARRLGELLTSMSYADPAVRPLLDLEGLTRWEPGRTTGFAQLEAAVDLAGFYDSDGRITAPEYRP
jgi:phosphonate transport system substrate-binding protein